MYSYHRVLLFCISLVGSGWCAGERFAGVDLWLPKSYQSHYLKLLDAAEKAKNSMGCAQLLSGRIIEERSTMDHPYFHFRCRTDARKTFSIQVDGNSLALTNTYADQQRELEQQRLAEERSARIAAEEKKQAEEAERLAQLYKEQSQYWGICRRQMKKRLQVFDGLNILTKSIPEALVEGEQLTYVVLFDAKNDVKNTLHYKIVCTISGLEDYKINVMNRDHKK